ncbi:MAG: YnbE family lipoprotein [Hyphomonas oceanitis]|uniref:YnbE family lipoprotein n=1 Tax=Hyphomonas oceanitis TaxID=81033 RepID=UPI0030037FF5
MTPPKTILLVGCVALASACTATIRIEPSDKPITINLNVKIDQEVRIKLDKEVEDLISNNPDLFPE